MTKNLELFDEWNIKKQEIHFKKKNIFVNKRDVVYISIGQNIGYEQNGKNSLFGRPVLVVQKFGNTFVGLPLSSKEKLSKYYFPINFAGKSGVVILSQIRLFDTRRIQRKMGNISQKAFVEIILKLKEILEI